VLVHYNEFIITFDVVLYSFKILPELEEIYQLFYDSNGNVNQADVDAKLDVLSADLQAFVTAVENELVSPPDPTPFDIAYL